MNPRLELVLGVLKAPSEMRHLQLRDWDVLISAVRGARLLSRLAMQASEIGMFDGLPVEVRRHLEVALTLAQHHDQLARWGWRLVRAALPLGGCDIVALKGSAYQLDGLPNSRGRLYNDIDILVPHGRLDEVEHALVGGGWEALPLPPHQERYYRRWLHELPAMVHRSSGIRVDVHHNILPAIDSLRVDAELLRAAARPAGDGSGAYVLCDSDMVLHCAAHLFRRGTYVNGLRDLADLDDMMRWFTTADASFWPRFADRARLLNLRIPAALAARYSSRFMATPVPPEIAARIASWLPAAPVVALLDRLIERAITPPDLGGDNRGQTAANWLLERYPPCLWKKSILPKLERVARVFHARSPVNNPPPG